MFITVMNITGELFAVDQFLLATFSPVRSVLLLGWSVLRPF